MLQVHGFMMFSAWGLFFPCGAMVARYFKHINQDGWIRLVIFWHDQFCVGFISMLGNLKLL